MAPNITSGPKIIASKLKFPITVLSIFPKMLISDVDFIPPHEIFITPKFSLPMEFLEPHQIPFLDILRCQKET